MELPAEGDDQRTSGKSCNMSSKGGLKPQGRRLERMMLRLKAGLQKLPPTERRKALEQLSSPARQALLRFMTKDLFAAPHGPRALRQSAAQNASREARVRKHRGVREVPTGLFQASISFRNFLVRSRTSRSFDTALRFFGVLQRFREIAIGSRMLSNAALEAARLAQAQAEACREAGISDGDLKPSYSASVSTQWAGKVESPATSSLQKALVWRQRLEAARGSWQQLREAWMSVLQDERPGGSVALKRVLAEARVDRAARTLQGREGRANRDKVKHAAAEQKIRKVGIALQKFEKLMSRKACEGLPSRHGLEQGDLRLLLPER